MGNIILNEVKVKKLWLKYIRNVVDGKEDLNREIKESLEKEYNLDRESLFDEIEIMTKLLRDRLDNSSKNVLRLNINEDYFVALFMYRVKDRIKKQGRYSG